MQRVFNPQARKKGPISRENLDECRSEMANSVQSTLVEKNDKLVIGLGVPKFVLRSGIWVESDAFFAYFHSMKDFGGEVTSLLDEAVPSSNRKIQRKAIDLLLIDGNQRMERQPLVVQNLLANPLRRPYTLVDIGDCYFSLDGLEKLEYWLSRADQIVLHNSRAPLSYLKKRSVLLWPFFPLPEKAYSRGSKSVNNKCIVLGSQHRQRHQFINYAKKCGVVIEDFSHSQSSQSRVLKSYKDYINTIRGAQMIFSNGYVNRKESIIVGRAGEAFLAGTALLYEKGSDLSFFFSEYKSFLPVSNVHDFVDKVSFIYKYPEHAMRLTNNALSEFSTRYSSETFWRQITLRM